MLFMNVAFEANARSRIHGSTWRQPRYERNLTLLFINIVKALTRRFRRSFSRCMPAMTSTALRERLTPPGPFF
jgi:hypothetical protein